LKNEFWTPLLTRKLCNKSTPEGYTNRRFIPKFDADFLVRAASIIRGDELGGVEGAENQQQPACRLPPRPQKKLREL